METPILYAGQRRTVTIDGVSYTLRALSYAEVSAIGLSLAGKPQPSEAVLHDAIRQACIAAGRQGLAEAVDAYDAARDALMAIVSTRPSDLDQPGQAEWARETGPELRAARREMARAERAMDAARYAAAGSPEVLRVQHELLAVAHGDTVETLAAALVAINDESRTMAPAEVSALPASHVIALAAEARGMSRPSESAVKN